MRHISLDWINKYKDNLINFSNITEYDIQDIWHNPSEPFLTDFSLLQYDYDIPLYQKMIFRYRNGYNLATNLYQGCDPCNKRKLLYHFDMLYDNIYEIIDFFAWISHGLGPYHIKELKPADENDNYLLKWKANNIEFYFSLSDDLQIKLVNKFNKTCIDKYNDYIKKSMNITY